jgi:selenocysteine lyase/cysteine desulfurase
MTLDLEAIRSQFPALGETDDGVPRIYLDNPAGTQVPQRVVDAMSSCMLGASANMGGYFRTSLAVGDIAANAQHAMADFLNAPSADEIIFGQNMTSLTFHISRSVGRYFEPGDEIVLSRMDHDANVGPWTLLARDCNLTIRWLPFDKRTFEFDLRELENLLNDRTRLVCVCAASPMSTRCKAHATCLPTCRSSAAIFSCVRHTSSSGPTRARSGGGAKCWSLSNRTN